MSIWRFDSGQWSIRRVMLKAGGNYPHARGKCLPLACQYHNHEKGGGPLNHRWLACLRVNCPSIFWGSNFGEQIMVCMLVSSGFVDIGFSVG